MNKEHNSSALCLFPGELTSTLTFVVNIIYLKSMNVNVYFRTCVEANHITYNPWSGKLGTINDDDDDDDGDDDGDVDDGDDVDGVDNEVDGVDDDDNDVDGDDDDDNGDDDDDQ